MASRRTDVPFVNVEVTGYEDASVWSILMIPPLLGLTSTVSLKLAPGQPAEAGSGVISIVMTGSNTKIKTIQGKGILKVLFAMRLASFEFEYSTPGVIIALR